MRARAEGAWARGQVLVEVLLILPIFLFLVFTIMEIGYLAFRTILLHHAAYEVARYGSLTATAVASPGCTPPAINMSGMQALGNRILPGVTVLGVGGSGMDATIVDDQEKCMNYDVSIELRQRVDMVFPMTGLVLATPGTGNRSRILRAQVRMPIERPLFK